MTRICRTTYTRLIPAITLILACWIVAMITVAMHWSQHYSIGQDFLIKGEDIANGASSQPNAGRIEHCRYHSLNTLFKMVQNSTNTRVNRSEIRRAKQCWKESLVFYLSYPMDFAYGSHVIPLMAALWATNGAILELGSGWFSTPMIHRVATIQDRSVLTAEASEDWLKYFRFLSSDKHALYHVNNGEDRILSGGVQEVEHWEGIGDQHDVWSLIFVDHEPAEQRKKDLQRLRNRTHLFIIHDSEPNGEIYYHFNEVLTSFKYRSVFGKFWSTAFTDIVSDTRQDLVSVVEILSNWGMKTLGITRSYKLNTHES